MKTAIEIMKNVAKFQLSCSHRVNSTITMKSFNLNDLFFVPLLRTIQGRENEKPKPSNFELKIIEDTKPIKVLFNATLRTLRMKIEDDQPKNVFTERPRRIGSRSRLGNFI